MLLESILGVFGCLETQLGFQRRSKTFLEEPSRRERQRGAARTPKSTRRCQEHPVSPCTRSVVEDDELASLISHTWPCVSASSTYYCASVAGPPELHRCRASRYPCALSLSSQPSTLEKTNLESFDGSSSFSCRVSGTPKSSALFKSIDLHCRLSGQILHCPRLCWYQTRSPA